MEFGLNIFGSRNKEQEKLENAIQLLHSQSLNSANYISQKYSDRRRNMIRAKEFNGIVEGQHIRLGEGVDAYCIFVSEARISFIVINKDGKSVEEHMHDVDQIIHTIKGKVKEIISNKIAREKELILIKAFEAHQTIAIGDSIYLLHFNI